MVKQLKSFLVCHLNLISCAKPHLLERLPELELQVRFKDIRWAIKQTCLEVERQTAQFAGLYALVGASSSLEQCDCLISMVETGLCSDRSKYL